MALKWCWFRVWLGRHRACPRAPRGAGSHVVHEELSLLPAGMQGMFWKLWQVPSSPPYPGMASMCGVKDQSAAVSVGSVLLWEGTVPVSSPLPTVPVPWRLFSSMQPFPSRALGRAVGC